MIKAVAVSQISKTESAGGILKVPLRQWKFGVFHHTVTDHADPIKHYAEEIDKMHREGKRAGYPPFKNGMGYHFVIELDGTLKIGDRWIYQLPGGHCRTEEITWNDIAIGVAIIGNLSWPKASPTLEQLESFQALKKMLFPLRWYPHFAFKATECPGTYFLENAKNWFTQIDLPPLETGRLVRG